jgi:hypothetical protein
MRTAAGRDFQADVMGGGALAGAGTGTMRPADYIGLTESATAPADGDTALAGELAAAGGGLVRSQAAYSHGAGASTYLLSKTFTTNANDAPPKTPAKYGVFNAAAAGRMPFSSLIASPPALLAADQLTVNVTVNL